MTLRVTIAQDIVAPPDRVWRAIEDIDGWGDWMQGLVRIERLSGDGFEPGLRFREVRRMFGREAGEVFEVVEVEPGRRYVAVVDGSQGSSRRGTYRFEHRLEPTDTGTRLVLDGEVAGMGPIGRVLGRLFLGPMRTAIARDLASLAAFVEGRRR